MGMRNPSQRHYNALLKWNEDHPLNWTPKPWIALLLNVFLCPLGLVYAGKPGWAGALLAAFAAVAAVAFLHFLGHGLDWIAGILQIVMLIGGAVLAYRAAKSAQERIRPWHTRWYALAGIAVGITLSIVVLRVFFYEPFRIPSRAMEPTAEPGAMIMVQKFGYGHFSTYGMRLGSRPISAPLKRGDIIVFDYPRDPSQTYVKRIAGLPGDHVVYRAKQLIVNGIDTRLRQVGAYLGQDYDANPLQRFRDKLGDTEFDTLQDNDGPQRASESVDFPFRDHCVYAADEIRCDVPAGNYFVLGDNRDISADSRHWGFVRSDLIIGKVVKINQ